MNKKKKLKNSSNPNIISFLQLRNQTLNDFRNKKEFYELIFYVFGINQNQFIDFENKLPNKKQLNKFFLLKNKLKFTPIEYIVGMGYFFGMKFIINKNVLIPRPETELIVEEIINDNNSYKNYADICTGSGCIAIAVSKHKEIENIFATDISKKAIKVAKKNNYLNNQQIFIKKSNLFNFIIKNKIKLNLLTMNPPYIALNDINVSKLVKNNEPKIALYAKDSGLFFYKKLFEIFNNIINLEEKFKVICEFGFEQKESIENLFNNSDIKHKIEFKKDLANNLRYFIIEN